MRCKGFARDPAFGMQKTHQSFDVNGVPQIADSIEVENEKNMDKLTSLGEEEILFVALQNETARERVQVKTKTVIGKAVLSTFVLQSVSLKKPSGSC